MAFALYLVFAPVNRAVALLAAVLRLVYTVGLTFAGTFLCALGTDGPPTGEVLTDFDYWRDVGLIAFGAHVVVLVWIAGIGYLFESLLALSGGDVGFELSTVTFIGEVALLLWLLATGISQLFQRRSRNASQR